MTPPSYSQLKEVYILGAIGSQAFMATRLIYKWTKNIDDMLGFIKTLKSNHLPHIDLYLKLICKKLDIPYDASLTKLE